MCCIGLQQHPLKTKSSNRGRGMEMNGSSRVKGMNRIWRMMAMMCVMIVVVWWMMMMSNECLLLQYETLQPGRRYVTHIG